MTSGPGGTTNGLKRAVEDQADRSSWVRQNAPRGWAAVVTNDPNRDFDLYVEIEHKGRFVARIQDEEGGEVVLTLYGARPRRWPQAWVEGLVPRWREELVLIRANSEGGEQVDPARDED